MKKPSYEELTADRKKIEYCGVVIRVGRWYSDRKVLRIYYEDWPNHWYVVYERRSTGSQDYCRGDTIARYHLRRKA
jgi:hypothetical protein